MNIDDFYDKTFEAMVVAASDLLIKEQKKQIDAVTENCETTKHKILTLKQWGRTYSSLSDYIKNKLKKLHSQEEENNVVVKGDFH